MRDDYSDLDEEMGEPTPPVLASPQLKQARPRRTKAEDDAKRAARKRSESSRIGAATRQRRQWEQSPEGQARQRDIVDYATKLHNDRLISDAQKYVGGIRGGELKKRLNISLAQAYEGLGIKTGGHGYGEQQLFKDPDAAPEPKRWEELTHEQRANTEHRMRMVGTSLDQMSRDFGAQLDQAYSRAHAAGHVRSSTGEPVPFTAHFYGDHPSDAPEPLDHPQEMLRASRQRLAEQGIHVSPGVHQAAVAFTSPNTLFTTGPRGERVSPNMETAEAVIRQFAAGVPHHKANLGKSYRTGKSNQGRPANAQRAVHMLEQVEGRTPVAEVRNAPVKSSPEGSSMWGPKTGPFSNSFDPQHPDFLVGDLHTFGGGMLSHLKVEKPLWRDQEGNIARMPAYANDPRSDEDLMRESGAGAFRRRKSERELAIVKLGPHAHAAADYAARQALSKRGLGSSVHIPQAAQWGEEQIQRKTVNPRLQMPTHEEAYPPQVNRAHIVNPNQMRLFGVD